MTSGAGKAWLPYAAGVCLLFTIWTSIYHSPTNASLHPIEIATAGVFIAIGIAARVHAIRTLERFFLSHIGVVRDHRLITTGLYSFVRHPSEAGLLMIGFGVPALLSSAAGLAIATLMLLPLSLYRISMEDSVLTSAFGNEFLLYKRTTPALLPRLFAPAHRQVSGACPVGSRIETTPGSVR